jgi:hypothetical protein
MRRADERVRAGGMGRDKQDAARERANQLSELQRPPRSRANPGERDHGSGVGP